MSLKLFRSTGFSSILYPGETRVAMHPGWPILAASAWVGFACNVALWRAAATMGDSLRQAVIVGLFVAASCGMLLSLLGWRKTLKPATTALLVLAALAACGIWSQGLSVDGSQFDRLLTSEIFPTWASLLGWQVPVLMALLALPPVLWLWPLKLRRLAGQDQLRSNLAGMAASGVLFAATGFALMQGHP